ncbi:DoxX family membrane protein [candidate division KSB1 bacterium]|nr:DoxX family membrane protein [candidate division KSB1 bacterium]MBL7095275.1 DoxX family membrane protein [candidate division KSB1 bacterium]
MKSRKWDYFILILSWLIAVTFIFAGVGKIINPEKFAVDIDNYRMLPYLFVTITAVVLPWLEVLCGLVLIFGKWKKGAALILLALSFIFFVAISSAMIRGLDISCGCFAVSSEAIKIGYTRLVEDVILFGAILLIYLKILRTPH